MRVHLTTFASYSLVYKTVQERSAVIAERGARVSVNFEFVGRFWILLTTGEQL